MIGMPVCPMQGVSMRRGLIILIALFVGACGSPTTPMTSTGTFTITDIVVGTGATISSGNIITVNYTGWLYDTTKTDGKGTQFDSSLASGRTPLQFELGIGQVIAGWDQGLIGMKVGGTRRLIIPPALAYGSAGSGTTIPPNATLVFDVILISTP
jgi:FKBP-type peptidyl-prolyl cis-trans isomerase